MKAYEMGEAGQVVLFPMTPQEIAVEAALFAAIKRVEIEGWKINAWPQRQ
ncbi:MAG: hypothetical protein KJP23_26645 [Deltaproteobacteria bacterium]|nr:hypothetical protein [Deltaproteobacteria bacterium]